MHALTYVITRPASCSRRTHYSAVVYTSRLCVRPFVSRPPNVHTHEVSPFPSYLSNGTSTCFSLCGRVCVCTRILLARRRGGGLWKLKGRTSTEAGDGIRSACVSDVLMTLRNTEQANQYGRHCVHSGARHVPPRVIASGNVSAASECRNESVHVRRDSLFRDTVDPVRIYVYIYDRDL